MIPLWCHAWKIATPQLCSAGNRVRIEIQRMNPCAQMTLTVGNFSSSIANSRNRVISQWMFTGTRYLAANSMIPVIIGSSGSKSASGKPRAGKCATEISPMPLKCPLLRPSSVPPAKNKNLPTSNFQKKNYCAIFPNSLYHRMLLCTTIDFARESKHLDDQDVKMPKRNTSPNDPTAKKSKYLAKFNSAWITEFKWCASSSKGPEFAHCNLADNTIHSLLSVKINNTEDCHQYKPEPDLVRTAKSACVVYRNC